MQLSIVIPALNERIGLPAVIEAAAAAGPAEIVVVDGGSDDGTREWVRSMPVLRLLEVGRGRGLQLNAGACAACGDVLLFLHADCLLPPDAGAQIASILQNPAVAGGCFRVRFAERRPRSLNVITAVINGHSRALRYATGDQAIFVRRAVFDAVGGFPAWPLFEDVEFAHRVKQAGGFVVLSSRVTLSARRWLAHGVWRTSLLMSALYLGYRLGVPPARLKAWYRDVR